MKPPKLLLLAVFAILSSTIYLLASAVVYRLGFPLDDAWIHQTYARNFAYGEGWSFEAGEPSGGATAPLWTFLLSFGYWLGLDPLFWTFLLGIVFFILVGILTSQVFQHISLSMGWLGLFFLFEWHFVWASVSGMETILAIFLVMAVYVLLQRGKIGWGLAAFLAASVWIRPDLISLSVPVLVGVLVNNRTDPQEILKRGFPYILVGISILAYCLFNLKVSEALFPTTFYAKQAEYMELRSLPLLYRIWQQFSIALVGGGVLLIFGFIYQVFNFLKNKSWQGLAWIGWYLSIATLYAMRLPVTYQHGRYMMPALGVYYLIGLEGSIYLYRRLSQNRSIGRTIARAGLLSWVVLVAAFWILGAKAYARDVQVIETQMVETAKWAEDHLPANSRIAVHDIGAMGYFTNHNIIDLAGLINPEVIPFLRDESRLAEYLDQNDVDYLICFPQWYPALTRDLTVIHVADSAVMQEFGEPPMTIFRWGLNRFIR
ncbi:MAG: hypothetical protein ANABAC_0970 [Anaerolineae bacterium]|jgi:hypothetical protein|nr:MAG: hypothetical protein ANABAC_0970 [Anaerolineae bacterium]